MSNRIIHHPILGNLSDSKTISFTFNGMKYEGIAGETVAASLFANNIRTFRVHEETGAPRSIYCNIGHCFECRVTVNGKPNVRACMTVVEDQMVVQSGLQQPTPLKKEDHI
ncbi:(2Fe-2S)-binding protein [Bacillus cereus]|uniref:(2Fe-2S)-binding protein n=1 Tax=Bacillus cereus TaxID=1396 RepID=UPI00397FCD3B